MSDDLAPGTFEYIEAKIRREANGTSFGGDFEWLCKWFLENAPKYRGQFERVWLWKDWPNRWGGDAGIDIVAKTRSGELWAVQAKADHPDRSIPKREIDSFLSESNRPQFAFRLLMATTDDIGATARRTLREQEKEVGLVLRGHLITEPVRWPDRIGSTAKPLPRRTPRKHQKTAIKAVVDGFQEQDRGRLIMACGTGKTLTALWIAESLQSTRTLVLVPSLSLVQQNLSEWGLNGAQDFDPLVVCSDETVGRNNEDAPVHWKADLGMKVTTDAADIRRFLNQRRQRPAVVFATYQSSDRVAAAQAGKAKPFDLVICDEAHRLAGKTDGLFATILHPKKIKARKRLFMTATPRYFKEPAKRKAAELDLELASMDDQNVFGPEFHVLTFQEAINADPPLLTDYQVVVIGVTDREARASVEDARLVRTADGLNTDARTLAAQIGLAKAMKKYNLRKLITFHSSVAKAKRFVDPDERDSLPGIIPNLSRSSRPTGKLWTKHISGETPAGQRATLLKGLGTLPDDTRGILSNCACLGEGVDVPVLDGVAFIDPKRSMVDIIQAVGRVIRKSEGKVVGTIVIPVFVDESEKADDVLTQSVFDPVWQVLKALRAHDRRLADELDQLRLSLGKQSKTGGRIHLPTCIHFDVPSRLDLPGFEQAFYARAVELTTDKPRLTIEQILAWADEHEAATGNWPNKNSGQVAGTDESWIGVDSALRAGLRGLRGGLTLAQLLSETRGVRNGKMLSPLTIQQILEWADAYYTETGNWPKQNSGKVVDAEETWSGVDAALKTGLRGLPGGASLPQLLSEKRGVRNFKTLPLLTIQQILDWADAYYTETGKWPRLNSGPVTGTSETWKRVHTALYQGIRGLPGGESLAQLLSRERSVRNQMNLPSFTIQQILEWADAYEAATGNWPNRKSGQVTGTDETWDRINDALSIGLRGLPGASSLARMLFEKRSTRNIHGLSPLTKEQILAWADGHMAATGNWPNRKSGQVTGTDERWSGIDSALKENLRGLSGGLTLAQLLSETRGVRNGRMLSALTIQRILDWADGHEAATGNWPNAKSGKVAGTDERWSGIDSALKEGLRGLRGGLTLAQLLSETRGVRNGKMLSPLTIQQILEWADAYEVATGNWPNRKSGQVTGTDETWVGIDAALCKGRRGLPGESSLAKLLSDHHGVRNVKALPALTTNQILAWADEYKATTGKWPNQGSGRVTGTEETWLAINSALWKRGRGLPGRSSLAKLLSEHHGVRNIKALPALTTNQILAWADEYKATTGKWPNRLAGQVAGTDETWAGIDSSLSRGARGLIGGSSLPQLLELERGTRNHMNLPALTTNQILAWADEYKATTGKWPNRLAGQVAGTDETWAGINGALGQGTRGLPGGSTLVKLLQQCRPD